MIGASTRLFAVLGDPVAHSLSPGIQNPAIEAAGVDAVYVALRCGAGEVSGLMRGLAVAGGGGNVTLPHKEVAAAAVDEPSELVARTGACNTFWLEDGRPPGGEHGCCRLQGSRLLPPRTLCPGAPRPPAGCGRRGPRGDRGPHPRRRCLGLDLEPDGVPRPAAGGGTRRRARARAAAGGRARRFAL